MVHPRAVIGDQLQPVARRCDEVGVDRVGDGGDQHVAVPDGGEQRIAVELGIVRVQRRVEQFGHPRLDPVGQAARHDDLRAGDGRTLFHFASMRRGRAPVNG